MPDHDERKTSLWPWILASFVPIVTALAFVVIQWCLGIASQERALLGDWLGGTIAVGVAFAGTVLFFGALHLQRAELELQRKELAETRAAMRQQTFEQTFAQLLSLLSTTRSQVSLGGIAVRVLQDTDSDRNENRSEPVGSRDGITALGFIRSSLVLDWRKLCEITPAINPTIDDWYADEYDRILAPQLGHYFRLLYRIFKVIDEADFGDKTDETDKTRQHFAKIVRATLSDDELWLLFYNCASRKGNQKFMPLADKYNLFDTLCVRSLMDPKHRTLTKSTMADDQDQPTSE